MCSCTGIRKGWLAVHRTARAASSRERRTCCTALTSCSPSLPGSTSTCTARRGTMRTATAHLGGSPFSEHGMQNTGWGHWIQRRAARGRAACASWLGAVQGQWVPPRRSNTCHLTQSASPIKTYMTACKSTRWLTLLAPHPLAGVGAPREGATPPAMHSPTPTPTHDEQPRAVTQPACTTHTSSAGAAASVGAEHWFLERTFSTTSTTPASAPGATTKEWRSGSASGVAGASGTPGATGA